MNFSQPHALPVLGAHLSLGACPAAGDARVKTCHSLQHMGLGSNL